MPRAKTAPLVFLSILMFESYNVDRCIAHEPHCAPGLVPSGLLVIWLKLIFISLPYSWIVPNPHTYQQSHVLNIAIIYGVRYNNNANSMAKSRSDYWIASKNIVKLLWCLLWVGNTTSVDNGAQETGHNKTLHKIRLGEYDMCSLQTGNNTLTVTVG